MRRWIATWAIIIASLMETGALAASVAETISAEQIAALQVALRVKLEQSSSYADFVKQQQLASSRPAASITERALRARAIANAYEHCGIFAGVKREEFFSAFYRSVRPEDPRSAHRIVLANWMYQQCADLLDNGTADLGALRIAKLREAAAMQDLVAQIAVYQIDPPNDQTRPLLVNLLQKALDSGDAEALWEAGRALNWAGVYWPQLTSQPFPATASGKSIDGLQAVVQLAACELGYPCNQDSLLMKRFCIREHCRYQSYANWLPSFMSAAQVSAVRSQLPAVLKSVRARAAAKLLWKARAAP